MTAPELCKVTAHFDPWVRILTDLENKNDNEKENLSIVICTLAFYIFQSICKRERIKGKAYRNLSKLSTRMTSDRDSWPCFLARSVALSFGPGNKQAYCQLALFVGPVGAVCSHGQGFLLKLLTRVGREEYVILLEVRFTGDVLHSQPCCFSAG